MLEIQKNEEKMSRNREKLWVNRIKEKKTNRNLLVRQGQMYQTSPILKSLQLICVVGYSPVRVTSNVLQKSPANKIVLA